MRTCPTPRCRSARRGASTSATRARWRCASAMSASWAIELYIPQECAAHVYETLWDAGQALGIANAGYRAIDSARLEKGYLYWSGDISPDYNPFEAGLGFCVALDKGEFLGREALLKIKAEGVTRAARVLHGRGLCAVARGRGDRARGPGGGLDHQRRLRTHARASRSPSATCRSRWPGDASSPSRPSARAIRRGAGRAASTIRAWSACDREPADDQGVAQARQVLGGLALFAGVDGP